MQNEIISDIIIIGEARVLTLPKIPFSARESRIVTVSAYVELSSPGDSHHKHLLFKKKFKNCGSFFVELIYNHAFDWHSWRDHLWPDRIAQIEFLKIMFSFQKTFFSIGWLFPLSRTRLNSLNLSCWCTQFDVEIDNHKRPACPPKPPGLLFIAGQLGRSSPLCVDELQSRRISRLE